ncbi:MAG: hypothetical protein WAZ18_06570 [Alphaproteobacteria bacterium]
MTTPKELNIKIAINQEFTSQSGARFQFKIGTTDQQSYTALSGFTPVATEKLFQDCWKYFQDCRIPFIPNTAIPFDIQHQQDNYKIYFMLQPLRHEDTRIH